MKVRFTIKAIVMAVTLAFGLSPKKSLAQAVTRHVYLIIGQSNAAGRGALPTNMVALSGVDVLNSSGNFVPATPDLNIYSTIQNGATQGYNLGYTFGETVRNNTGVDVGLVVNARGGSVIHHWVKGASQGFYNEAVSRTKQALAISGTKLAGVIWHQGESSYGWATYEQDLISIIEDLRSDFNDPNLPFVAGELYYKNAYLNFNFNRISQIPGLIENTAVTSAVGLSTFDNTHFTTASLQLYGDRYAVEMLRLQGYTNITVQDRPGVSLNGGTYFRPNPNKYYHIEGLVGTKLAADGSSNVAFAAVQNTTGDQVTWKFTKKSSSNTYHIELVSGGNLPRVQTPNNSNLAMVPDTYSGGWTSFELEERALGEGVYHITAPKGPTNKRIYVSPSGFAGSTTDNKTGNWATFKITEAGGPIFVPDPDKTYYIQALSGVRLSADGQSGAPLAVASNTIGSTVTWKFVKKYGESLYHIELASEGTLNRLQAYDDGNAAMTTTSFSGGWTSFILEERSPGEGVYHITAPNGPTNRKRIFLNPTTGHVGTGADTNTGSWSTYTIIEANASSARIASEETVTAELKKAEDFTVYPNPASNMIHVSGLEIGEKVMIYDMSGHKIFESENKIIDLSSFEPGIYLIKSKDNEPVRIIKK